MSSEQSLSQILVDLASANPFAAGILHHFYTFWSHHGHRGQVLVTITTRAGQQCYCYGLHVQVVKEVNDCILFHGNPPDINTTGIVLRNDDVASVLFHIVESQANEEVTPFGFAAYTKPTPT